jgi:S1-C subfamily serine protease
MECQYRAPRPLGSSIRMRRLGERCAARSIGAPLGNSDRVRIAKPVFVIGAPLGMDSSVSSGILSARRRPAELADLAPVKYMQTDAAINHGDSGGALLNLASEVGG